VVLGACGAGGSSRDPAVAPDEWNELQAIRIIAYNRKGTAKKF
jgi:hypothetical protein